METMQRLAELAVVLGANVQPDQVVLVEGDVDHRELVLAVAEAAYRRGARFVDVDLRDQRLQRARVIHAREDSLSYAPSWLEARVRELDDAHGAAIEIRSPEPPGLFEGLPVDAVNRAQPPRSRAWREVEYRVNNTIIAGPTTAWAQALRPGSPADAALTALWRDVAVAYRLDQPHPVEAWRARFDELRAKAQALNGLRLDAVRLLGPGTDLVVGLPPSARWESPTYVNQRGVEYAWNLPSEELYTVPDRDRVDGHVRLTRPVVVAGRTARDLTLTFRAGRVEQVSGGHGVEALQAYLGRDAGTSRLGELALVDGASAVGSLQREFGFVLFDENCASHLALGFAFPELVDASDRDRLNTSGDHLDLMVGSDEVEAIGIGHDGTEQTLLRHGEWRVGS